MVARVRRLAPRLQEGLRARYADHGLVGEIRGVGLVAAVELVLDKATGQAFDLALGVGAHCMARAVQHGVILRALGDTIAFSPPLIVSEAQIDQILDRFGEALRDTAEWLGRR